MAARVGTEEDDTFEAPAPGDRLIVDVDGFEGPLDLLLELARRQTVDLRAISILALVEQYLCFVEDARGLRLELAADYLVMAAWLTFLKSRLLLPEKPPAETSASDVAACDLASELADRLRRLGAIREAARLLDQRPQLGRDVALRGMPDAGALDGGAPLWTASMFDLLSSYARQRQKQARSHVRLRQRAVWPLAEARAALEQFLRSASDWTPVDDFFASRSPSPAMWRSVRASTFAVALELVKEGRIALRQDRPFEPLWLRERSAMTEAREGRAA